MSEPKIAYTLELTKREAQALSDILYYGMGWDRSDAHGPTAREIHMALTDAGVHPSRKFRLRREDYARLTEYGA